MPEDDLSGVKDKIFNEIGLADLNTYRIYEYM